MKTLGMTLLLSLVWAGCSSENSKHAKAADPTGNYDEVIGPASQAMDPVSGDLVTKDSAWSVLHKGNWYFFTSEDNKKKFVADPTAFITDDGRMKHDLEAK